MNLLEQYKDRLKVSESFYSKSHNGDKLDSRKQLMIAQCLKNTANFLQEAFDSSNGTQRVAMGDYKRFCLNMLTVALPSLIAPDLVITQPMTSITGYIPYMKYTAGVTKGQTTLDTTVFSDPWTIGENTGNGVRTRGIDDNYTGMAVVENFTSFTSGTTKVAWTPVLAGSIKALDANGNVVSDPAGAAWTAAADGTITAGAYATGKSASDVAKIAYQYDNVIVPQEKLPTLKAEVANVQLFAKPRRIAIFYSQLAAFQSKQDYGVDLSANLVEQACGRLAYEIDTEITDMLINAAPDPSTYTTPDNSLVWSKTLPVGVSKMEHYAGFLEVIEIAKQKLYDVTRKFVPNYMLVASNIMPVISMIPSFKPADYGTSVNGPYFAGTLGTMKVYVTPNIEAGKMVFGVNGSDLMSSAGVYAPYMPIVPTQLLEFADGGASQGFATMYDAKILNSNLLIAGHVTD